MSLRASGAALRGRWKEAAAGYAQLVELEPDNHEHYHALAPLLVQTGDWEGYRKNCQNEVARFRDTQVAHVAERMAEDCLILPNSGVDLKVVTAWTDLAVTAGKDSGVLPWFQHARGLAEYRQGRFAEAIEWAQKALSRSQPNRDLQATAGNLGATNLSFPGYLTVCITVGATDSQDRKAGFSNAGAQIDLVAPGQDVLTVGRFGTLESVSGTSFSTPLVAGVCALLAALRPNLNQAEARQLLCAGADDQVGGDTDPPGFDNQHGWGRLNAFNSLRLATTRVDVIERTNDTMHLSWLSPGNAGSRHPYQVEYRSSFGAAWMPLTNANAFRYESHRTHWIDDGWQTGGGGVAGFYRVGLRPF